MNVSNKPAEIDSAAKTRLGRLRMLGVLLVCAAPVIASYYAYYIARPEGRTNYGVLLEPQRAMPAQAALRTLSGKAASLVQLRGNWLLVSVDKAACDEHCTAKLYAMRQLRTAMGKDRDRLDRVWLLLDEAQPSIGLKSEYAGTYVLRINAADSVTKEQIKQWLATPDALSDNLFLIDPQGNAMMRFPKGADPSKIKRDVSKLLRASAAWQESKPPAIEGAAL